MREWVRKILLIVSIVVLIFSSGKLVLIYLDYKEMRDNINELREQVTVVQETQEEESFLIIDWEALLEINNDVIGWIQIPNTEINYPILQGKTNDTYLRTDINMKYSNGGSIFIEATNKFDFSDENTIIYGHNMRDGSMFSDLHNYTEDSAFYEGNEYVYIYTPDGLVNSYKIISAHNIDATSDLYTTTVQDDEGYRQMLEEGNVLDTSLDDIEMDNLLMLSTCYTTQTNEMTRTVAHAVLQDVGLDPEVDKPH